MYNIKNITKKKSFIILPFLSLIISCSKPNFNNLQQHQSYNNYNNQDLICEEYVNRIGKLLLIVDNNKYNDREIKFSIKNQDLPSLEVIYNLKPFIKNQNHIIISTGVLNYLQDEAELATILAIALEKINNNFDFQSPNLNVANKADSRIVQHLYRAGYDPRAFVELQEEFLKNKHIKDNWLKFLFANSNLSKHRIDVNNRSILNISKGLKRDRQNYLSNIYLLKNS